MDRSIGIVGVGQMGSAMWRHLHDEGVTAIVFDSSVEAAAALANEGAPRAMALAEVTSYAETVICSLPRSDDVARVLLSDDGVVASARAGTLIVDTTSGTPSRSREIAAECAKHDVSYLDAGVSGGVAGARSGALSVMVGGSDVDFAVARPVLALLGSSIWHCGPPGTGHAMKTVLNLANQAKMLVEIEALLVGRAAGLDAHQMADIMNLGVWKTFLMGEEGRRKFGFSLGMSVKDYDVGVGLAEEEHVPLRTLAAAHETMHLILDALGPDVDIVDYVSLLEHDANVELPNHEHAHEH